MCSRPVVRERCCLCCALPVQGEDEAHNLCMRVPRCLRLQKKGNGADTYLHRVGRAGRFGTKGLAITFVASKEDSEVLNQVSQGWACACAPACANTGN
jgi:hypothetical protein